MRVLLVDDETELITSLAERLELRGISAQCAASGKEAMGLIEERTFDIAVLDIRMPGTGGVELMRQIETECPETGFVFLSGNACEQTYRQVANGCKGASYLVKPVNIDTLIDEINELMRRREDGDASPAAEAR